MLPQIVKHISQSQIPEKKPRPRHACLGGSRTVYSSHMKTTINKIVVIGDSLTNDSRENWTSVLQASMPGLQVIANGHGGWTTMSYFKPKFRRTAFDRVEYDADLFIIQIGSNNLFEDFGGSDYAIEEACEGVCAIADHICDRAPKAHFMLVAPPDVALNNLPPPSASTPYRAVNEGTRNYLKELGKAYQKLARRKGWLYANWFASLKPEDLPDGTHPNAEGNRKLAAVIAAALKGNH